MSLGREAYDGNGARRYPGITKWGDTVYNESKTGKYAAKKRTNRNFKTLDEPEYILDDSSDKDRYILTYADLITLLLGLFIILYAMSNIDLNKYEKVIGAMNEVFGSENVLTGFAQAGSPVVLTKIERLKNDVNNLIKELNYSDLISVEENERGVTIRIQDDILFNSGSAKINIGSKEILLRIANIIRNLDNDIRVEGHTDNIQIHTSQFPSNWHLSVNRALNTGKFLIDECGINPERVSIVGNGEFKPIASNDTPEGRAKNRRVDIVIIK